MKVTVKVYLNVRVGSPSVNAPCYQYLAPGSEIEVDGKLYKGDVFEGVNTWFKDAANNYYWSGGVNTRDASAIVPSEFIPEKMSWAHNVYNIPLIWSDLKTLGKGITVAVIDTGVDVAHLDLVSKIHPLSKSFVGNSTILNDIDGHGTNMAGIIGASGKGKVYGVAPDANLLILKASDQIRGANVKLFAQALEYASSVSDVDIISFSNVFLDDADLKSAIQKCISAKKIVVSAIGNGRDFIGLPNGPDKDTFPACYDNVVAVGAFDSNGQICTFSNWNSHLSFLAPGDFSVLTTGINNTVAMGAGTSIATAFTAGCLALMLSYAKNKSIKPERCIQAILETCDDVGSSIGKDIQSGQGKMNVRNAITKLK